MTKKLVLGVIIGLIIVVTGCGVIEKITDQENAMTETHRILQEKYLDITTLSLLADGGSDEANLIPTFSLIQDNIKHQFEDVINKICLIGALPIEHDENSYPINGDYLFDLDNSMITTLSNTCNIITLSIGDTIKLNINDAENNEVGKTDYVKTIIIDLSNEDIREYDIGYSNKSMNILMTKDYFVDHKDRMIINYDLDSKVLITEYMSVLNSSTTQLYFYRTYMDTNNVYVTFFDNKDNHVVFSTTPVEKSYELNTKQKKWTKAQSYCVEKGGALASIFSSEENHALKDVCFAGDSREDCWIGLNDREDESTLMWANQDSDSGTAYTYELENLSWNTIGRDCFNLEGTFQNIYIEGDFCNLKKNFICEYNDSDIALSLSSLNPDTNDLNYVNNHCINKTTGVINTDIAYPCGATMDSASDIHTLGKIFLDLPNKINWFESGNHINFDSSTMGTVPLLR